MTQADKARVSRRAFLHRLQDGLCYLGITPGCRARGRITKLNGSVKHPNFATIEHVVAKSKMKRGDPELLLIACAECNTLKGDADPLDSLHVIKAEAFRAEWIEYCTEESRKTQARRVHKKLKRAGGYANAELGPEPPPFPTMILKHPKIPLASTREQMLATLSPMERRAIRNAETQEAARRGIEERGRRLGIIPRKPPTR